MSIIAVNKGKISSSPINNCCSKMMFSFPRAARFPSEFPSSSNLKLKIKKSNPSFNYNPCLIKTNQFQFAFSKQQRIAFPHKIFQIPSPSQYNVNQVNTSFQKKKIARFF